MKYEQQYSPEKKELKIEFPNDIKIVRSLQNKLAEYRERLQRKITENPNKPPEAFADTTYKIKILEELLLNGEVNGEKLFKKITTDSNEAFDFEAFGNAYGVIEDYAKTGGKNTTGGTGLKIENLNENFAQNKEKSKNINLKEKIAVIENFDDLYLLLDNIKGIQGSSEFYESRELKQRIESVRDISKKLGAEAGYNMITRSDGLRDKVVELLKKDINS